MLPLSLHIRDLCAEARALRYPVSCREIEDVQTIFPQQYSLARFLLGEAGVPLRACAIVALCLLGSSASAETAPARPEASAARVIVIFGAALRPDGSPTPHLRQRLERALKLARQDPAAAVIVTGGERGGRPAEGPAMRRWLVTHGMSADRIVVEARARHTGENADFTTPLLRNLGAERITLITSGYHQRRARFHMRWALRAAGMANVFVQTSATKAPTPLARRCRLWFGETRKIVRDLGFRLRDSLRRWRRDRRQARITR